MSIAERCVVNVQDSSLKDILAELEKKSIFTRKDRSRESVGEPADRRLQFYHQARSARARRRRFWGATEQPAPFTVVAGNGIAAGTAAAC